MAVGERQRKLYVFVTMKFFFFLREAKVIAHYIQNGSKDYSHTKLGKIVYILCGHGNDGLSVVVVLYDRGCKKVVIHFICFSNLRYKVMRCNLLLTLDFRNNFENYNFNYILYTYTFIIRI